MLCQTLKPMNYDGYYLNPGTLVQIDVTNEEFFMDGIKKGCIRVLSIQDILNVYRKIIWPPVFSGNRVDDMAYTIHKLNEVFGRPDVIFSRR
jgi:hypothetical protein